MKNNWQTKKLGDIAKIQAGYGFPKNIQGKLSGDFPFIKVGDMNYQKQEIYLGISENYLDQNDLKENGYRTIPSGTIIFPKIGGAIATNKKRILAVDSLYDNNVMGIIPTDVVLSEYLYYWLNTKNLSDWASGTSLPAINKSTIEAEEIPLPPLATQHQIVTVLDEKFAKLREAKQLRQDAIVETEKILGATLREIFEEGEEKGWEELDFGNEDYLKIIDGDRGKNYPTKDEFSPDGYCLFLSTSNVRKGNFDFRKMDFITKEKDESLRKGKVSRGDIILTTRGTLGNSAYYDDSIPYDNIRINSGMVVLRTDHKKVLPQYLIYIINSNEFVKKVQEANSGSAQPQLPIKVLSKLSFPLPPLTEQQKIVTRLDALSDKLRTLRELQQSQLDDMKRLEKAYLREAFRGELV